MTGEQHHEGGKPDSAISPPELKRVLRRRDALVEGGRAGHGRTSDGRLEVELSVPAAMSGDDGPGTNPEQLFAVGYAACFQSALLAIAQGRNVDASGSQIASRVGIGPRSSGGGFGLQVWLDLRAPRHPRRGDARTDAASRSALPVFERDLRQRRRRALRQRRTGVSGPVGRRLTRGRRSSGAGCRRAPCPPIGGRSAR